MQIVAASADLPREASKTVERYGLTFPVGCRLDVLAVAEKTGAFFDDKKGYLQATGIIVNPEGKVMCAAYSTSAIGRLVPDDCLGLIKYLVRG